MRRSWWRRCGAILPVGGEGAVLKDYRKLESERKELVRLEAKQQELAKYPLRYQLLECPPGLPLALTKMKYLLACRRTHPEAGGDAESFLRVSLAYQDVMKDYGVETIDNKIVNLGNFQTDDHAAQNYLDARTQIQSYIPMSTLEDYIHQLEEVKSRLGDDLAEKLAANNDEAMWLLEDIEDIMEQSGLKTVRLKVLEDGTVTAMEALGLTDGTEKPVFLPKEGEEKTEEEQIDGTAAAGRAASTNHYEEAQESTTAKTAGSSTAEPKAEKADGGAQPPPPDSEGEAVTMVAEVSAGDIEVLNAKHNVQDRTDVAGLASRTATEVMNNTDEVKQIKLEFSVLFVIAICIVVVLYLWAETKFRAAQEKKKRPQVADHIQSDTMLPWWGNDAEYESQVKRIFVEEWRRARASSRRTQTQQDGIARESMDDESKKRMDLQIFVVTAEKLRAMRTNAENHPGRQ